MKLEKLQLVNFRTYEKTALEFPKRLCFIIGPNAAGKTNIIEAVSLLSMGKSFRGASDQDMVRHEAPGYFLSCSYRRFDQVFQMEMGCDVSGRSLKRKIKLNGKALAGRSALIGNLISVIFSPSDISIVEGGPAHRRKFLDMVLSSHDSDYLRSLITYNRALKQRNAILKKIRKQEAKTDDLKVWNENLAGFAEKITRSRQDFVRDFREIFYDALKKISNNNDELELKLALSSDTEESNFIGALEKYVRRDIALGYTTTGPHRHNLTFEKNGHDILHQGSQGQKRSLVLALRISQFYYLKHNLHLSPILLIDDVIRELDANRRSSFIQLLRECGQAIFTTPDLDGLDTFIQEIKDEVGIYELGGPGVIEPVGAELKY